MAKTERPAGDDEALLMNGRRRAAWRRWVPVLILLALAAAVLASGWHERLSPRAIAESHESLQAYVHENWTVAVGLYMLIYAAVVALSLPFGAVLTVLGGFLFGPVACGLLVVVAATVGATIVFLVAKWALGEVPAKHSGRIIAKMRKGFQDNALSYMLFLRLVPAFPFTLVNLAPAFLGVSLRTYVIGTFFGIIPGTFAFAFVGGGLDSILGKARSDPAFQACMAKEAAGEIPERSCSLSLDFSDFVTTEVFLGFALLGVVALIPAIWRIARSGEPPQD